MRWFSVAGCMLLMGLMAAPAQAWSELGHRMIGDLAELQLHATARAEVQRLLQGEDEPTLGGVASWADALRHRDPPRFRSTARWHYINARGGGCGFDEQRDCDGGGCIVSAINAQRRILSDRGQPHAARRDALKYIVHFVGDLHQPLHAGSREDSGGNGFQVSLQRGEASSGGARVRPNLGTNLHTIWDAHVLASAGLARVPYVARLRDVRVVDAVEVGGIGVDAPIAWARESCALVESRGIYPQSHTIGQAYLDTHRPLAEQRVTLAAARLAALLNEALRH